MAAEFCCSDRYIVQLIVAQSTTSTSTKAHFERPMVHLLYPTGNVCVMWRQEVNRHCAALCERRWPGILAKWPTDTASRRRLLKLLHPDQFDGAPFESIDIAEMEAACALKYPAADGMPNVVDDAVQFLQARQAGGAFCQEALRAESQRHAVLEELFVSSQLGWIDNLQQSQRNSLNASNVLLLVKGEALPSCRDTEAPLPSDAALPIFFQHIFELQQHALRGDLPDVPDVSRAPYVVLPLPELRDAAVRQRWLRCQSHFVTCLLLNRRTQTAIHLARIGWSDRMPYGTLPTQRQPTHDAEPARYSWLEVTLPDWQSWAVRAAGQALRRGGFQQRALDISLDVMDDDDAALCLSIDCYDWELGDVGDDGQWSNGSGLSLLGAEEDGAHQVSAFELGVLDSDLLPWSYGYDCWRPRFSWDRANIT